MMINFKQKSGFTLVEMMVSVSIFVIVAFIITTSLLVLSSAYKESIKMRLIIDNFNFTVQNLTLELREAVILDDSGNNSCPVSGTDQCIFNSIDNYRLNPYSPDVCYMRGSHQSDPSKGTILRCKADCLTTCRDLLSPDINIRKMTFEAAVNNSQPQPVIKLFIDGSVDKGKNPVNFSLQTSVTNRNTTR